MSCNFTLSCCSTVDVPYSYLESRHIPVLFYTYVVDDVTYVDDMGRDPNALPHFYEMLAAGKLPQTSQINVAGYMDFFERLLQKGGDVLHIAFTSGQSCSVNNAYLERKQLQVVTLGREYTWFDTGNADSLYEAAGAIQAAQRSGKMIGCLEETALRNAWITIDQVMAAAKSMEKTKYGQYLLEIAAEMEQD